MTPDVHQFDPESRPDSDYELGTTSHLVAGNRGRLLDPRRTPVRVVALDFRTGHFTVEIEAFEDRGALWDVPFEDCARHYQFELGSAVAAAETVAAIETRAFELDRTLEIPCDPARSDSTRADLAGLRSDARTWLERHSEFFSSGAVLDTTSRTGPPALWADLRAYLTAHDVWDLEDAFTSRFVSNPHSGECVKGHRIVLAELGLATYRDTMVRDPSLFEGAWSRARRARHLLHRLAFVHEMLSAAGRAEVTLYRGLAFDGPLDPARRHSFVSSSFDVEVARSCYAPRQATSNGILMRQVVPIERVFMTYLETEAMNRQFHEAEAVLLHEDGNPLF